MIIIGADYHPGFQQIAFVDTETGDCGEQRLEHCEGATKFYRDLASQRKKVRVGMEASGHARWFERLLEELHIELWVGDAAVIRAKRGRKAKTDRQDALHILNLLLKAGYDNVRDLARFLVSNYPQLVGKPRTAKWTEEEISTLLREVIIEQLGVTNFDDKSRFVQDLHID